MQVTLDQTDEAVFHDLLQFARQHHRAPGTRPPAAMQRRLPTALVLAGGVNSADHCTTFPNLAGFLRRSGCRAALLSPATFGRFPGDAVGEILRQLSGRADSREELLDDLVHWYREETGVPPPEDPFHPFQAAQPATTAAAEAADPGESAASGHADADARQLRARGAARPTPAQQAARAQPLVVVVEGTEGVDARCLRDFIACASEVSCRQPHSVGGGLAFGSRPPLRKQTALLLPSLRCWRDRAARPGCTCTSRCCWLGRNRHGCRRNRPFRSLYCRSLLACHPAVTRAANLLPASLPCTTRFQ